VTGDQTPGGNPPPGGPPPGAPPPGGYPPPPPGYQGYPGYPGYQPPGYGYYGPPRGTNGFAIASLVCAFVCAPLGLIFGFMARKQIRESGQDGDGLALAGIIVSAVSIALLVIWFLLVVVLFSSAGTVHINNSP
jgi:hypothetical protein